MKKRCLLRGTKEPSFQLQRFKKRCSRPHTQQPNAKRTGFRFERSRFDAWPIHCVRLSSNTFNTHSASLSLRPRIRLGAGELPGMGNKHSIQGVQLSLSLNAAHCGSKSSGSSHEAILQITPRIQSTTKSIFTADLYSCWVKLVHSFFLVTFPQHKAPLYNLFFLFEILPQNTDPNRAKLSILPLTQEKYHNFARELFKYQLHYVHSLRLNRHQQLTLLFACIPQRLITCKSVFSLLQVNYTRPAITRKRISQFSACYLVKM